MSELKCRTCGANIYENDKETINICPKCGSTELVNYLVVCDRIELHDNAKGKTEKIPGKRKYAKEYQSGQERSVSLNKWVDKQRVIDRENNRYYEKVTDIETGEIIHECEELLTEHLGHGSDKKKQI